MDFAPPPQLNCITREEMMAQDTFSSTRDTARESGTKGEVAERERNLEPRRESGARRGTGLSRRTPYFGATATPFSLMRRMAEDIERLFSDADYARAGYGLTTPQRYASTWDPWRSDARLTESMWAPQVETFRKDGNIVVRADLPGLTKDNVNIEVEDDVLVISGERSDETRDERDEYYRTERSYGRFFRAIQLPEGVDAEKIDATFKDGVLEVKIPTPTVTTPKNRQIKIK